MLQVTLPNRVNKRMSYVMAALALSLGLVGLCGWIFNSVELRSFLSNGAVMMANSAIMIIIGGTALILLNGGYVKTVRIIAGVIFIFCVLIIAEHLFGIDFKIDNWLFRDIYSNIDQQPGRTSLLTAINLLLISSAVLLVTFDRFDASQLVCAVMFLLVYAALVGHIFGITGLYSSGDYALPFHIALGLLLMIMSLVFYQSDRGWIATYLTYLKGRNIALYLLSYLLCAAPMLVAFYLFVFNRNGFSPASGIIVLIILSAFISLPVAYLTMRRFNRMDSDLETTTERLQMALNAAKLGSYDLNLETGRMACTPQCKANYGLPPDASFNFGDLFNAIVPEHRERVRAEVNTAIDNHADYAAEYQVTWPDESVHWVKAFGKPQYDKDGTAVSIVGVTIDITGQKELEAKKDAFIGMVSHELKTPLTSVKAYLQLATNLAEKSEERTIVDMLTRADVQANKMKNMVQGFLDVTRLENGKLKLDREMFDVKTMLEETIEEVRLQTENNEIELKGCESILVYGDRDKISEVVTNLLTNAIKYSPKESPVVAECKRDGAWWQFSVTDQGVGINPKEQKKLFERFYRVQRPEHRMVSGFGIGLYLCAEIVKLHKGKIGVHSEEGKGSTFYFTIPV
ncbi:sensor histidine kinase [Mucilaginibacter ginkgonis]|uniref:histidine kinase n=1 Tax=Mucilaginibacter ginkgonis TaxID=2682091 RepID=A0A6I4HYC5_9SPHI|nr:PAS domain-containing sensor histidine kinase [Mucilaginibacter ginkgonis]QQL49505.1 PAS domain-containing protein [Mucilaginibacter ginkgonis]